MNTVKVCMHTPLHLCGGQRTSAGSALALHLAEAGSPVPTAVLRAHLAGRRVSC